MPAKVAQELARHSDPRLTLGVYAKCGIHDLDSALSKLPNLDVASDEAEQESLADT